MRKNIQLEMSKSEDLGSKVSKCTDQRSVADRCKCVFFSRANSTKKHCVEVCDSCLLTEEKRRLIRQKPKLSAKNLYDLINLFNIGIEISSETISVVKNLRIEHLECIFQEHYDSQIENIKRTRESMIQIRKQTPHGNFSHQNVQYKQLLEREANLEIAKSCFNGFICLVRSGEIAETIDPSKSKYEKCRKILGNFFGHSTGITFTVPNSRVSTVKI